MTDSYSEALNQIAFEIGWLVQFVRTYQELIQKLIGYYYLII